MDRVDIADKVRAAALDAGILPHDPLGPVVGALADLPDEINLRIAPILAEMQAARAAIEKAADRPSGAQITDRQVEDITQRLLGSCEAWARVFIRTSYVRSWALLVTVLLVTLVVALGTGWRLHSPASELTCADQADGSRICWMYTRLPTQPAAVR